MAYITYRSMNVQIIVYHMFVHAIGHFAVLSPGALEKECHFLKGSLGYINDIHGFTPISL